MSEQQDFRQELYKGYVSAFKQENLTETAQAQAAYDRWADARYYPLFSHLPKNAAILDLGCGPGRTMLFMKSKGFTNVTGVDISEEQTEIARRRGLNAITADVKDHLVQHSNEYDMIIMIDVVEHFSKAELIELFKLIHYSLKKGGIVIYQTVNGEGMYPTQIMYGDLTHMTYLTAGSSEQLLRATGFDRITAVGTPPVASGLKGILRSIAWTVISSVATLVRMIETGKKHRIWTENFVCRAEKV
ncbi:MAG TPA: class I SAM-dependent methyltransferase [Candidatus Kapabacteria bacterium]|nr:class I SAM-dependent methyltransferase [Candidatus Kapabacteria bacterium]